MKYIDVCSGISAPTMAWKPLGWEAACFAEIEAAPRSVLAHHYPDTPLRGDFTEIKGTEYGPVDLLVGGTPCQSFSVAGLRGGLADDRGNLALEYLRLADRARPRWLVWENVPGVLSSNRGRDFGAILGGMGELGYGFAYAVLDAQFFGVPQRRRRVFVVGYLGDWRRAAAVLFERHSLSGHPAPRREAGQDPAKCITRGVGQRYDPETEDLITDTITSNGDAHSGFRDERGLIAHSLRAQSQLAHREDQDTLVPVAFAHQGGGDQTTLGYDPERDTCMTIGVGQTPAVAFTIHGTDGTVSIASETDTAGCIRTKPPGSIENSSTTVALQAAVRRLTPRECERLQGFPDDFTLVPHRGKPMADGPRYKMLGNSMAVPVLRWIGERIAKVDALGSQERAAA